MSFEGQLFLPSSLTACFSVNWYVCHCCMAVPSPPLSLFDVVYPFAECLWRISLSFVQR